MKITKTENGAMCISESGTHELVPCEDFELSCFTQIDEQGNYRYLLEWTDNECIVTENINYFAQKEEL